MFMQRISSHTQKLIPLIAVIIALITVFYWLAFDPTAHFVLSEPGKDASDERTVSDEQVTIGEFFTEFGTAKNTLTEKWPRFRGALSDNISTSKIPLVDRFGAKSPKILWSVQLGEGHSGASIYNGLAYILDYDEDLRSDMLRCFVLDTGEELWRRWYSVLVRRNHGMSRTVPAVTENFIVTIGPRGHVMCVERETGNFLWGIDIEKEYESEIPLWYTGQCPLIEDDVAVIATGGTVLMIGVSCFTGKVVWETPNKHQWKMSHSSVMPFTFKGRKMFVYSAVGGVAGVAADGPEAGKILWETSAWNHPVVAPSPVCMPDGKIFLTAGYGAGSMLLQLHEKNGEFKAEVIQSYKPGEGLSSEQQTPILVDGHLFGVMPKDARGFRNQWVCVNPNDPTRVVWSSGSAARFGLGPYVFADNKFFLLNDDATLCIIEKNTKEYRELSRVQLFDGFDAWAPLAIADGFMILRDSEKMICIDLKK
jgi:outer membrane protein assembly factor BamB